MTRFFVILFVLSILASGGIYYWKTQHPEGDVVSGSSPSSAPSTDSGGTEESVTTSKDLKTAARKAIRQASKTQDLASLISIAGSILSGFGALLSAYFSFLRYRQNNRRDWFPSCSCPGPKSM